MFFYCKRPTLWVLSIFCLFTTHIFAQNVNIDNTGKKVTPSALLDISSSNKGFLVPHMSSPQRLAMSNPTDGLLVYDITTSGFWYFENGSWVSLIPGSHDDAISDSDSDTGIQTEESPDEDIIRFDINNAEKMSLKSNSHGIGRLELHNEGDNLFIGEQAGSNMNPGFEGYNNIGIGRNAGINLVEGNENLLLGQGAGSSLSTHSFNTLIGNGAGSSLTNEYNTMIGFAAGSTITNGFSHTIVGTNAGEEYGFGNQTVLIGNSAGFEASGSANILIGESAGFNASGDYNIYIGRHAGYGSAGGPSGGSNVAIGGFAGAAFGNGTKNVFIGHKAAWDSENTHTTVVGAEALGNAGSSDHSVHVGYRAGYNCSGGHYNSFFGDRSGYNNTTGDYNAFLGTYAGYSNNSGGRNTYSGTYAGYWNNAGSYNSFFGYYGGYLDLLGSNNSSLGMFAGGNSTTVTFQNSTAIGAYARYTASNQIRMGRSSTSSIGGYQAWTNLSDGRFKQNVTENVPGLEFVMQLRPVTYTVDIDKLNRILHPLTGDEEVDAKIRKEVYSGSENTAAASIVHTGFIAQEVEAIAKELDYEFDGVDLPKNAGDHYGLRYATFVVPLVKAVQELKAEVDALKAQLEEKSEVEGAPQSKRVQSKMEDQASSTSFPSSEKIKIGPNPAHETLLIQLQTEQQGKIEIVLSSLSGREVKKHTASLRGGSNQIQLDLRDLASGLYLLHFPGTDFPEFKIVHQ